MRKLILIIILFVSVSSFAQWKEDSVIAIPGKEYEAGSIYQFFMGSHWRSLWTTPIKVKILDLNSFAGGLTPIRKGGGMATKSLRFQGNDGLEWKFRSINKDPRKTLPKTLRNTLVGDVLMDQTSTSNPIAPLIVAPILNAVGILQAEPQVVQLPDSPKLGKFRDVYGEMLGMIEMHPDESDDENDPGFHGSEKVMGTFKLLDRLADKRSERVNSKEFLKARLVDIFLGDWDRHTDQWRWAKFEYNDQEYWHPIPRDRDQAFARFTGLFPKVAAYYIPQMVHFDEDYPQVEDITWSGRFLDRRYLSELTKTEWDSVTAFVHESITDSVIEFAVRKMPKEYFEIEGTHLINSLKARRDKINEISDEFYLLVNEYIDVFASEEDDYLDIERLNDDYTKIELYRKDKDTGGKKKEPLYSKLVDSELTKQIRVYLGDGDDKAVIKGKVGSGPIIRVIGGDDEDVFVDKSNVKGYLFGVLPFPYDRTSAYFYDSDSDTKLKLSDNSFFEDEYIKKPTTDEEKYEPEGRDRSVDWLPYPLMDINSNYGLLIGGGVQLYSYDFRQDPFASWMGLSVNYGSKPNTYAIYFDGIFNNVIYKASVNLSVNFTRLQLINYYGYGNETNFNRDLEEEDFYEIEQELFESKLSISKRLFTNFEGELGVQYENSEIHLFREALLEDFPIKNYGLNRMELASLYSRFEFDSRDKSGFPSDGSYLEITQEYFPELLDNKTEFAKVGLDFRTYFKLVHQTNTTLSLRVKGEKIWGNFPFHKAVFVGGDDDLRGFSRRRFSGKSGVFGQTEIRTDLFGVRLLIPGKFGVFGFGELGRVFEESKQSEQWHPSYGGGFYLSFINREFLIMTTIAKSPERYSGYLTFSSAF